MIRKLILLTLLLLSFFILSCSRDKSPTEPSVPISNDSSLAQQTHILINDYRRSQELSSLSYNQTIADEALGHSRNMAMGSVPFSHDGFNDRINTIANTLKLTSAAENVAYNWGYENPAEIAVSGWLESPGHYKNIIGDFNVTGIGVAENEKGEYYFTQIFVKTY